MADLTPNNREEFWLQGMVDGQTTLEPNKRREYWYKEIVDAIGSGGGGGTGGGVLVVHNNDGTLDKTWQEITNAGFAIVLDDSVPFLGTQILALADFKADEEDYEYGVSFINLFNISADIVVYTAESAEGYPSASQ